MDKKANPTEEETPVVRMENCLLTPFYTQSHRQKQSKTAVITGKSRDGWIVKLKVRGLEVCGDTVNYFTLGEHAWFKRFT